MQDTVWTMAFESTDFAAALSICFNLLVYWTTGVQRSVPIGSLVAIFPRCILFCGNLVTHFDKRGIDVPGPSGDGRDLVWEVL